MCQSKEQGGLRCPSHAKTALSNHQGEYVKLVLKEAEAQGSPIDSGAYALSTAEMKKVQHEVSKDPEVKQAEDRVLAIRSEREERIREIEGAILAYQPDRLKIFLVHYDPARVTLQAEEKARRDSISTRLAKSKSLEETRSILAGHKASIEAYEADKELLIEDSRKLSRKLVSDNDENEGNAKYAPARAKAISRIPHIVQLENKEKAAVEDARKISEKLSKKLTTEKEHAKLRALPEFKEVEKSSHFFESDEFKKWNDKKKTLEIDYMMTNEYQNKLKGDIKWMEEHHVDSDDLRKKVGSLIVRRNHVAWSNISKSCGENSPKAVEAKKAYFDSVDDLINRKIPGE